MNTILEEFGVSWEELICKMIRRYVPKLVVIDEIVIVKIYLKARCDGFWNEITYPHPHDLIDYIITEFAPEEFIMEWKMKGWVSINCHKEEELYVETIRGILNIVR